MKRVLVVDDDFCILQVAKAILERSGYATVSADNGAEALNLLQTHVVDVLVTDIVMPGMSGSELIEEARKRHPDLPVCCMTAYIPLVDDSLDVPIIPKPFAPRELINAVRQIVEARPQSQDPIVTPSGSLSVSEKQIREHA
jgi:CheY-like chemotaxis protein